MLSAERLTSAWQLSEAAVEGYAHDKLTWEDKAERYLTRARDEILAKPGCLQAPCINADGCSLSGECSGSGGEVYPVSVHFHAAPGGALRTSCTCLSHPKDKGCCKHVLALLLWGAHQAAAASPGEAKQPDAAEGTKSEAHGDGTLEGVEGGGAASRGAGSGAAAAAAPAATPLHGAFATAREAAAAEPAGATPSHAVAAPAPTAASAGVSPGQGAAASQLAPTPLGAATLTAATRGSQARRLPKSLRRLVGEAQISSPSAPVHSQHPQQQGQKEQQGQQEHGKQEPPTDAADHGAANRKKAGNKRPRAATHKGTGRSDAINGADGSSAGGNPSSLRSSPGAKAEAAGDQEPPGKSARTTQERKPRGARSTKASKGGGSKAGATPGDGARGRRQAEAAAAALHAAKVVAAVSDEQLVEQCKLILQHERQQQQQQQQQLKVEKAWHPHPQLQPQHQEQPQLHPQQQSQQKLQPTVAPQPPLVPVGFQQVAAASPPPASPPPPESKPGLTGAEGPARAAGAVPLAAVLASSTQDTPTPQRKRRLPPRVQWDSGGQGWGSQAGESLADRHAAPGWTGPNTQSPGPSAQTQGSGRRGGAGAGRMVTAPMGSGLGGGGAAINELPYGALTAAPAAAGGRGGGGGGAGANGVAASSTPAGAAAAPVIEAGHTHGAAAPAKAAPTPPAASAVHQHQQQHQQQQQQQALPLLQHPNLPAAVAQPQLPAAPARAAPQRRGLARLIAEWDD